MRADSGLSIAILGGRRTAAWYDGEDQVASELATRLAAAGHRVSLLCGVHAPLEAASLRTLQCVRRRTPVLGVFDDALFLARCVRGYDLIYVIGGRSLWSTLFAPLLGARVWYRVDGAVRRMLPWRRSAMLVVDSETTLAQWRATMGRLPPARVIPPGADTPGEQDPERLAEWELAPGCYYLLVGRPCRENHVQEIVEGFLAAHSTFPLVIVGAIDENTAYAAQLRGYAGARVRFVGPLPDAARQAVLRCHALACFHGNAMGSPSLLHALGCGAPLIAFDTAVNRELAGELAWYFSGPQDLPAAIARAEELDSAARRAHATAARAHVRERHAWERIIALHQSGLMQP